MSDWAGDAALQWRKWFELEEAKRGCLGCKGERYVDGRICRECDGTGAFVPTWARSVEDTERTCLLAPAPTEEESK